MKLKLLIFGFILLLISCITLNPVTVSEKNVSAIYNPGSTTIHPRFFVYHKDTTTSLLYIYLYTPELLFLNTGTNASSVSKVKIFYKIIESFDNETIIDSATTFVNVKKNDNQTSLVTFIKLKHTDLQKYILQILIKDEYRKKTNLSFIEVDKTKLSNYQDFIISYKDDLIPTFNNYFYSNNEYVVESNQKTDKLYITKYQLDTTMPLPPFYAKTSTNQNFKIDTIWKQNLENNILFSQKEKGIYFIQTDTSLKTGKLFINFGDEFPVLETSEKLFETLKYLTSTNEYEELKKIGNKKLAIDNFWLNTTSDLNQAKELIRIYYSRVMYANIYFSTYKEGWKTDRGMVYIIFGPPKIVNKKDGLEKWIYSDTRNLKIVTYEFIKNDNSISENDYVLKRDLELKSFWTSAIKSWREGKIFSLDY